MNQAQAKHIRQGVGEHIRIQVRIEKGVRKIIGQPYYEPHANSYAPALIGMEGDTK